MIYRLIVIIQQKGLLDCTIIYILVIIDHNGDVSPENCIYQINRLQWNGSCTLLHRDCSSHCITNVSASVLARVL